MPSPLRLLQLVGGCSVLGCGVAMLLVADLGSDGFSTLINGVAIAAGVPFWVSNAVISALFVALAALRGTRPGLGTVVQVLVVGGVASGLLAVLETPEQLGWRIVLLAAAFPVVAVGVATYLGSRTGAGPAEAAAQAWDPPVPFRWSYSGVQLTSAGIGWLLGATVGLATVVVFVVLGPLIDRVAGLLRLDVSATRSEP